jgi:hypothetical protein
MTKQEYRQKVEEIFDKYQDGVVPSAFMVERRKTAVDELVSLYEGAVPVSKPDTKAKCPLTVSGRHFFVTKALPSIYEPYRQCLACGIIDDERKKDE